MGGPKRLPFPTPSACCTEGHENHWVAARAAMGHLQRQREVASLHLPSRVQHRRRYGPSVRVPQVQRESATACAQMAK
eukprot:8062150-Pyramimonas_sp.AAC.1